MEISFRTKAGGEHGWGNIIRLYNFYRYLINVSPNYKYNFFLEADEDVYKFLEKKKIKFTKLKNKITIKEEKKILKKNKENNYLICEMLDLSYDRQLMYKELYNKVIVFDDLINQKYAADYVICAQEWPNYEITSISDKNTEFLIGYNYFIFNNYYEKFREKRLQKINKNVNSIVVILGGSDYENAYINIAKVFKKLNYKNNIHFILGFSSKNKNIKIIKNILPNSKISSNISNVAKFLYAADIAIVGGGYTKIEAAFCNTPCIVISVQWHQILISEQFSKITKSPHLGYFSMIEQRNLYKTIKNIFNYKERKLISKKFIKLFKKNSFKLIYEKIF